MLYNLENNNLPYKGYWMVPNVSFYADTAKVVDILYKMQLFLHEKNGLSVLDTN